MVSGAHVFFDSMMILKLTRTVTVVVFLSAFVAALPSAAGQATQSSPAAVAQPTRAAPRFAPTSAPTPELLRLGSRGVRAHDPSTVVKCGDEYWLFTTGPGVRSYRSRDLRQWESGPRVFAEPPAWARRFATKESLWAPDVIRAPDGRYLLYYSASSFGKNTSAIGLASNATLDSSDPAFRWVDEGIVVESARTSDFNAIDPAVTIDGDGRMWMSFGSFWSGIKLIELDPRTGKRRAGDNPIRALATKKEIEAPFIHRRPDRTGRDAYYLFVNWGFCCRGVKSTYNIRVGRSDRIEGPYLDRDGKDLAEGGGTLFFGSDAPMIGPGHAGVVNDGTRDWLSFHFYDATQNGRATLGLRPLEWDEDGWPVVAAGEN